MPDLDKKSLDTLEVLEELGENDKILIESGGRMKRISGSLGGGIYILDLDAFDPGDGGGGGGPM